MSPPNRRQWPIDSDAQTALFGFPIANCRRTASNSVRHSRRRLTMRICRTCGYRTSQRSHVRVVIVVLLLLAFGRIPTSAADRPKNAAAVRPPVDYVTLRGGARLRGMLFGHQDSST